MLTGRNHARIVRSGDGYLNRKTPDKSGRLGKYVKVGSNLCAELSQERMCKFFFCLYIALELLV